MTQFIKITKEDSELMHYGVLGMKWGKRRAGTGEPSKHQAKSTDKLAKKDAKRHVDAKMFYGTGAGTKRKLLKAELEKKKKDVPGYEEAFNKHVADVDVAKSATKAVRTRKTIDVTNRARITTKQVLGVTGPLSVAAATMAYQAKKPQVDAFVSAQLSKIISNIR